MKYFDPNSRSKSRRHAEIWAAHEIAYTTVDFGAAFSFVVGSALFFFKSTETAATWLFLIGSILFAMKPTIRLAREMRFAALGDYGDVAEKHDG